MAKQRGCKFVLMDPQYTDSAAAYDAWWIPIRPNTDAAMLAGMLKAPKGKRVDVDEMNPWR